MSRRSRAVAEEEPRPVHAVVQGKQAIALSESVPTGPLRLSGIVKTTNGFAVADVELTVEEWELIAQKRIGASQRFKEYIAMEHKRLVTVLGQQA